MPSKNLRQIACASFNVTRKPSATPMSIDSGTLISGSRPTCFEPRIKRKSGTSGTMASSGRT